MKKFLSAVFSTILALVSFTSYVPASDLLSGATSMTVVESTTTAPAVVPANPFESKYSKLAKKVSPAVVRITVTFAVHDEETNTDKIAHILGSGVFIGPKGQILTCAHLFMEKNIIQVEVTTQSGDTVVAEPLYVSPEKDLALLKVYYDLDNAWAPVSKRNVEVGEEVLVVGHPLDFEWTVVNGIVSGIHRELRDNQDLIQTNAVINPGNSGGPLFDMEGNVIGINVMIVSNFPIPNWSGQGFAVSTKELNDFLDKFRGL